MEVKYHLMQYSTGKVYAVHLGQQPAKHPRYTGDYEEIVLEAYGPLSVLLLRETHLAPWDYPSTLRIEDITWLQEALWKDLFYFASLDYARMHSWSEYFDIGWCAGSQFGQAHPDASDCEVRCEAMETTYQATASLEEEQQDLPWNDCFHGFFNGCIVTIGRNIDEHGV